MPPFKPMLDSNRDLKHFATEFTDQKPVDSYVDSSWKLQDKIEAIYPGFTYLDESHLRGMDSNSDT